MSKNILIIGGTRFFGPILVRKLLESGNRVTIATRGLTPDSFGDSVQRIIVDRRDERSMTEAFKDKVNFDVIYDQMCYSPLDAQIADKVFSGRVGRYIMSSTIETYNLLGPTISVPFSESALDLEQIKIDYDYPWRDPRLSEVSYGEGKRQSEAFFCQHSKLPLVSVRIGHVLSGTYDFTGRLAFYAQRVASGKKLHYSANCARSSFLTAEQIASFLNWVSEQSFLGPINAASDGTLSSINIIERVSSVLKTDAKVVKVNQTVTPSELSPFDFPFNHAMDTSRARELGYRFAHTDEWLGEIISQHVGNGEPA